MPTDDSPATVAELKSAWETFLVVFRLKVAELGHHDQTGRWLCNAPETREALRRGRAAVECPRCRIVHQLAEDVEP
jgi:hypothetical protein